MTATLEVTDSYLSFDSTQYAQVPIGATRNATKGNGTNLRGEIPSWTATNWEIEFDIQFPTTAMNDKKILDGDATGVNKIDFATNSLSRITFSAVVASCTMDGVAVTTNTITHPVDGAVHHIKLVGNTAVSVGTLLTQYSKDQKWSSAILFNLRLTDLDTPANSRFYPMDGDGSSSVITDTSTNAQHGTWYNRTSGNVVTVYPDAIRPAETFFIAARLRVTSLGSEQYPMAFSVGGAFGSTIVKFQLQQSGGLAVELWDISSTGVKTNIGGVFIAGVASGGDWVPLGTITIVFKKTGTTGLSEGWVAYGNQNLYISTSRPINGYAIQGKINLNGEIDTSENTIRKLSGINFHYVYLYSALSAGDITALMQGENPENVGTIRQGYNLSGDGYEVNGGQSLTLYNGPTYQTTPIDTTGLTGTTADILYTALYNMGYRGSLADMKKAYYDFYGYNSLTDNLYEYMKAAGWKGSIADMKYEYFRSLS